MVGSRDDLMDSTAERGPFYTRLGFHEIDVRVSFIPQRRPLVLFIRRMLRPPMKSISFCFLCRRVEDGKPRRKRK